MVLVLVWVFLLTSYVALDPFEFGILICKIGGEKSTDLIFSKATSSTVRKFFRPKGHMRKVNDELVPPYVEKKTLLAYTKVLIYTVFCYQLY